MLALPLVDLPAPDDLLVSGWATGRAGLRAALRQAVTAHRTLTDLGPLGGWLNRRLVARASTGFGVAVGLAADALNVRADVVAGLVRSWVAEDVADGRRLSLVTDARYREAVALGTAR